MKRTLIIIFSFAVIIFGFAGVGCKTPEIITDKGGAQLWGETCNRCHNAPDPKAYTDEEWPVIMDHMRLKAGLTDMEAKKILEFLQSAN